MGIERDVESLELSFGDLDSSVGEHEDRIASLECLVGMLLQGRRVAFRLNYRTVEATVLFGGFNDSGLRVQCDDGTIHSVAYPSLMPTGGET